MERHLEMTEGLVEMAECCLEVMDVRLETVYCLLEIEKSHLEAF
jgi:hypothetical protein